MLKTLTIGALIGVCSLVAGCLQKETSHTLYLAPDGSVEWVASEANVRSDDPEIVKRLIEEQGYIDAALLGTHGVARGLAALDPQAPVRTTIVRDERPFLVVTQAHFAAIDRVLSRVFTEMGIRSSALLVRGADDVTLRVHLDFSHPVDEGATSVSELGDNLEHLRIVLTDGRFGTASGFDVTDGISATLSSEWLEQVERAYDAKTDIELVLSWTVTSNAK